MTSLLFAYKDFLIDRKLHGYNQNGISDNTLRNYNFFIRDVFISNYCNDYLSITNVQDLSVLVIKQFVIYLRDVRNLSPVSVKTYYSHARIFIRFLFEQSYISDDFTKTIKLPRPYRSITEIYSDDDLILLFSTLSGSATRLIRARLVFALAFDTGMRSNEILNIKLSDINFDKYYLVCHGQKSYEDRLVPFSAPLLKFIIDYLKVRKEPASADSSDYLFISDKFTRLTKCSLARYQKTYIKPILPRGNMHLFRHTYITRQIFLGKSFTEVQEIVGHSIYSNTTRNYLRKVSQLKILGIDFLSNDELLYKILNLKKK